MTQLTHVRPIWLTICRLGMLVSLVFSSLLVSSSTVSAADSSSPNQPIFVADVFKGITSSTPSYLTAIGSTLFFSAAGDNIGVELYRIDPPYANPQVVADINPGTGSSYPENLTVSGNILFFRANDGKTGTEVWKTEPPYTSAEPVADVNPGSAGSDPNFLTPIGDALFFVANDGFSGNELWKSEVPYRTASRVADIDGGPAGSNPQSLVAIGWTLFFSADTGYGRELWKCTPPYSPSSTEQVKTINMKAGGNANVQNLTRLGLTLFFTADDGTYGSELWLSEPPYNTISTRPVNDFDTRYYNTNPSKLYVIGSTLFFSAQIGFIGREPWKVVPPYNTTAMTRVDEVNRTSFFASSFPRDFTAVGDRLFFVADDHKHGFEVWRSDPPYDDDHTEMVEDIILGTASSDPQDLTVVGKTLFFSAKDNKHGRAIWKSEPPYEHATLLTKVGGEVGFINPAFLTAVDSTLFFQAFDSVHGKELWKYSDSLYLPATGYAPGRVSAVGMQPPEKAYQASENLHIEIPALAVNVPLVGVPWNKDNWDLSWLSYEAGYLEGTAFPTGSGNSVITAHSYQSNGLPGPFVNLGKLKWGDRIIIDGWGKHFVYEVRSSAVVAPNDTSPLAHEDLAWLTLLTCQGYDPIMDNYRWRLAVKAVQVSVQ